MKRITKYLGLGAVSAVSIVANVALSGFVIASAQVLRFWAYPTFFGFGMMLSGLVFIVLVPPKHKQAIVFPRAREFLTIDESRLSKGIWPWVRKRGAFALVLAANMFIGPFFAALVIRFLGLTEQKAWFYAFTTTLISVAFWISIYIGVADWIRSMLAVVPEYL